jgi:histidinol phosphatase-like enzyme (inositol monophosphatase family)
MEFSLEDADELWLTAEALADAAAACCLPLFRNPALGCDNKAGAGAFDPVTRADRDAEEAMRAILTARRPDDGVLGEEFGVKVGQSGLTWVLDPIDGTRAFVSGAPSWGTLIGLNAGDAPVLGIIDQPYMGERFMGGFGRAVLRRGEDLRQLRVRQCAALEDAVLFTTFPEIGTQPEREAFEAVRDRVRLTRYGLDCYAYALVALGHVDLVIEAGLHPFDIQGPQAVVEAAGGIVTSWDGGPAHTGGRVIAAGDRAVHAAALEVLARAG